MEDYLERYIVNNCYTAWVEVDLDAIRYNYRHLKDMAGTAEVISVVKREA